MQSSENIDQIAKAHGLALVSISDPVKNKQNPAFRNKYADLGQVWDAVKPILAEYNLSLVMCPGRYEDGAVAMTYQLTHWESGQWWRHESSIPISKQDAQGSGGGLTYLARYVLNALFGLAAEDDDGNTAVGRQSQSPPSPVKATEAEVKKLRQAWEKTYPGQPVPTYEGLTKSSFDSIYKQLVAEYTKQQAVA